MSTALQAILAISIVSFIWLFSSIKGAIKAWHGRCLLYGIKSLVGSLQILAGSIFALYVLIVGAWLFVEFTKYWNISFKTLATNSASKFVYATVPMVTIFMVIGLALFAFTQCSKPLWKLTKEEQQYEKELKESERLLFKEKLARYPRIIR